MSGLSREGTKIKPKRMFHTLDFQNIVPNFLEGGFLYEFGDYAIFAHDRQFGFFLELHQ